MRQFKIVCAFLVLSFGMNAQLKTFDYFREIKPVAENGYYKVKLGSNILDREGYYRVYEINAKDTLEVPYSIASGNWDIYDRKYFKDLKIIDKSYESGKFSYATLVTDTNLIYNSVYLGFNASDFFKTVVLEGSNDNKSWKTIVEDEKIFNYYYEPNEHYYRNKIVFEPVSFKYLRIKMYDHDSEKLDLVSASIPLIKEEIPESGELIDCDFSRIDNPATKATEIQCGFIRKYMVTSLEFEIENDDPYHREVEVFFKVNNNTNTQFVSYGTYIISSGSGNKIFLNNYYSGDNAVKFDFMRLVVRNLDNRPLKVVKVKAYTHFQNIQLKLQKDKKYILAYGKANDTQPQYDIEYFRNSIPLNLSKAELGNEVKIPHEVKPVQQPLINNKMWIWVALIGCVSIIGVFAFKLMKPEEKKS